MSETIKSLEAKIKSNEKLLMDTITKVCEGKDVNKGVILSSIMYGNFDKYSYVNNPEKELFLKLSIIDKEFNKVQKSLNVKLDYEKCENILNKIKYNIFEDIKKIYKNRHINIEPEVGQNALTRGDRLAIFTISKEFDKILELHFSEIKNNEFNFRK